MRLIPTVFLSLFLVTAASVAQEAEPTVYPFDTEDAIPYKPETWRGASFDKSFARLAEDATSFYEQFLGDPFGDCVKTRIYPQCMCINRDNFSCWLILVFAFDRAMQMYAREIGVTPLKLAQDLASMVQGGSSRNVKRSCFWPVRSYRFPMTTIETNQLWTQSDRVLEPIMQLDVAIKNAAYYGKDWQADEQYQGLSLQLEMGRGMASQMDTELPEIDEELTKQTIKDLPRFMPEHRRYLVQSLPGTQIKAHSMEIPQYLFRNMFKRQSNARFFHVHKYKGGLPFSTSFSPYTIYSQSVVGSFLFPESIAPTIAGLTQPNMCRNAAGTVIPNIGDTPPWERQCLGGGLGRWAPLTDKTDVNDSDFRAGVVALMRGTFVSEKLFPNYFYRMKYGQDAFQVMSGHLSDPLQNKCYKTLEMPKPFFAGTNIDELGNEGISFTQWTNFKGCGEEGVMLPLGPGCGDLNSD